MERAHRPREHGAHAYESREGADRVRRVPEHRYVHQTNDAAQHSSDEQRRSEDASRAARSVGQRRGDELHRAEAEERLERHFSPQRVAEDLVAAAGDAS